MSFSLVLFFTIFVTSANSANILCVFPSPFLSHQLVFQTLWKEISLRGHNVTVITTKPVKDASLSNLTEVDLGFSYEFVYKTHDVNHVLATEKNLLKLLYYLHTIGDALVLKQLQHPQVQDLINSDQKFDLVICEFAFPVWYTLSSRFNCPLIGISSLDVPIYIQDKIGNPTNLRLYPDYNLPFGNELSLVETIISVVYATLVRLIDVGTYYRHSYLATKYLGVSNPDISASLGNMSIVFANVVPGFSKNRPNVPAIVEIHGLQLRKKEPLPKDLQFYLDSAKDGVIYFSLGSTFRSNFISDAKRKIILDALAELPYKILWKYESDDLEGAPENVKIKKWLPQQDVLRHPNVKLFITQGGLQSIEEAIAYKVPILGIPLFGDQFHNVKRVQHLGIGVEVNFETVTKEILVNAVKKMMEKGNAYRSEIQKLSAIASEQQVQPLETVIFWIEYVIRHEGAPHLRSPAVGMPFYKYYLLDVIAVLTISLFILLYLFMKGIKCVFITVCHYSKYKTKTE